MANKHYTIEDSFEVTIKVKVSNINISTYNQLSEEEVDDSFSEFKNSISDHLASYLTKGYYQQEVTECVDWWYFDIEK